MLKRTFLAAVITALLIPSVVSCGDNSSGSSESMQTSSTDPTGAAAIDALKEIAGESLKEQLKEVPALQSNTLPKEADEVLRACIDGMYCSDAEETLKYFYPKDIYDAVIKKGTEENFSVQGSADNKVTDFRIDKVLNLSSDTGCTSAEKYFGMTAESAGLSNCSVTVSSGYSVDISYDVSMNGTKESVSQVIVLVNIADEGWKVIPLNVSELIRAVS